LRPRAGGVAGGAGRKRAGEEYYRLTGKGKKQLIRSRAVGSDVVGDGKLGVIGG
jgi:hypothetical protein